MQRRGFVARLLAGGAVWGSAANGLGQQDVGPGIPFGSARPPEVVVERPAEGQPHKGKVLAAIQPHSDDISFFASGTVAKLVAEGYTGYLIRFTNDDTGAGKTMGETILGNESDNDELAKALGLTKAFNFMYQNHKLDDNGPEILRERMIFLIRLLKIDTVVCYDPWGLYEENPDHVATAMAVQSACWMAAKTKDYPEHLEAGLQTHAVREKYYFARGPQRVNRVVDIGPWIDKKVAANLANKWKGGAGIHGSMLKARLAKQNLRLPILGNDDDTANHEYIKNIVLDIDSMRQRGIPSDREIGRLYGLEWAEAFHYIRPPESVLQRYIKENAVPL